MRTHAIARGTATSRAGSKRAAQLTDDRMAYMLVGAAVGLSLLALAVHVALMVHKYGLVTSRVGLLRCHYDI